jgi:hypothetical protein
MIPFLLWNNHVVAFATFRPSAPWRATCFRRYGTTSMDSTEHYKDYPMNVVIDKEVLQSARHEKLVASIDQGTSSTRFMVFTQEARILASAQVEHTQYYPQGPNKVGWHEHDGLEIWFRCRSCIQVLTDELQKFNVHWTRQLQGIGITNQEKLSLPGIPKRVYPTIMRLCGTMFERLALRVCWPTSESTSFGNALDCPWHRISLEPRFVG